MTNLRVTSASFHIDLEKSKTIQSFIRRLDEAKLSAAHMGLGMEVDGFKSLVQTIKETSFFDKEVEEISCTIEIYGKDFDSTQGLKFYRDNSIALYLAYIPELKVVFMRSLLEDNVSPFSNNFFTEVKNTLSEQEKKIFDFKICTGCSGVTELNIDLVKQFFIDLKTTKTDKNSWEDFEEGLDGDPDSCGKEELFRYCLEDKVEKGIFSDLDFYPFQTKYKTSFEQKGDLIFRNIKDCKSSGLILHSDYVSGWYEFDDSVGLTIILFSEL